MKSRSELQIQLRSGETLADVAKVIDTIVADPLPGRHVFSDLGETC